LTDQAGRQTICLNMIVRNESHIVHEVLDTVAPLIDYWVIVDTGSDDGTQDIIRNYMAQRGIPGELHERPWRDFGSNRTEALQLAQNKCDYILVMDADDLLVGTISFTNLTADVYYLRIRDDGGTSYWRRELFRNGVPVYYRGVLHEFPDCDAPFTEERLEGDYYVNSRRLGARNKDPKKYLRDAEVLLAEVHRHPDDARAVFYLAQSYHNYGDFANGLTWYARRAEMGGWDEEVFFSMMRVAECMSELGHPLHEVQEAYLRSWEYRPIRAEPLYRLAYRLRTDALYARAYMFARFSGEIPLPVDDKLFVGADIYEWRALDEQAVCASWLIGKRQETFGLCRHLLAMDQIPEADRERITLNRDLCVPEMLEDAGEYPEDRVQRPAGSRDAEVTVTLVAGPSAQETETTLNSFLHCCTDADRVGRFVVLDTGLFDSDRARLAQRYPFLEFVSGDGASGFAAQLDRLRSEIGGRYWMHLGQGWQFFAPEALIGRLTSVLQAEPEVCQVGVNYGDVTALSNKTAPLTETRSGPGTGHYVPATAAITGPNMVDAARFEQALVAAGSGGAMRTVTLDEVLCVKQN